MLNHTIEHCTDCVPDPRDCHKEDGGCAAAAQSSCMNIVTVKK